MVTRIPRQRYAYITESDPEKAKVKGREIFGEWCKRRGYLLLRDAAKLCHPGWDVCSYVYESIYLGKRRVLDEELVANIKQAIEDSKTKPIYLNAQ